MPQSLLGSGFAHIASAMTAREQAQGVFSANIANADTPNYRVDRRTFEDFLVEKQSQLQPLKTTHSNHISIPFEQRGSFGSVFARSDGAAARMDGNTVDTQKEMVSMAENQMMHELDMQILKGRLSGMKNVIREGR